jgi:hypothetical protein
MNVGAFAACNAGAASRVWLAPAGKKESDMRMMLLAAAAPFAAIAIPASPAEAQSQVFAGGLSAVSNPHNVWSARPADRVISDRRGRHHGRHRDRDAAIFGGWGWYDADLNRSWESNSFNDWWHDRPDRSFPRWVRQNQNCERMWWSGGGWRC